MMLSVGDLTWNLKLLSVSMFNVILLFVLKVCPLNMALEYCAANVAIRDAQVGFNIIQIHTYKLIIHW